MQALRDKLRHPLMSTLYPIYMDPTVTPACIHVDFPHIFHSDVRLYPLGVPALLQLTLQYKFSLS